MRTPIADLEASIERDREALRENLQTLEQRIRAVFDWRQQWHKHPLVLAGVAIGAAVLLSRLISGRPNSRTR